MLRGVGHGRYRVDEAVSTWTFDVTGHADLAVSMDWAAMGDMPDMGITVEASLDGEAPSTIFKVGFTPAGDASYVRAAPQPPS